MHEGNEVQKGEDWPGVEEESSPRLQTPKAGFSTTPITYPILALSCLPGLVAEVPVQTHRRPSFKGKDSGSGGDKKKSEGWMSVLTPSGSFTLYKCGNRRREIS